MAANQIVLDSGAFTAIAKRNEPIRFALKKALAEGGSISIPTIVLAESTTGSGPRDARVNQLARICRIVDLDERIARLAASLRFARPAFGVADAIVIATADALGGSVVLTTDARDLRELASLRNVSRVVAI